MTTHFKASGGNRAHPLCNIPIDLFINWSTDPTEVDCEECRFCLPSNYEQPKQMKTWKIWFSSGGGSASIDADSLSFEHDFVVFRRSGEVYRAFPSRRVSEIIITEEDMK